MKLMRSGTTRITFHPCAEPLVRATSFSGTVCAAIGAIACFTSPGQSQASVIIRNQTRTGSRNRFSIIGDSRIMTVAADSIKVRDGRLYHFQTSGKHSLMAHRVITSKRTANRARRVRLRVGVVEERDAPRGEVYYLDGAAGLRARRLYSVVFLRPTSCASLESLPY